jgi:ArsR family transcriptional regulator
MKNKLYELAELFKVFGDLTRINILWALSEKESAVHELAESLEITMSAVSHQLSVLKRSRLVKSRKEGKNVYYSLDDEHIHSIFQAGLQHVCERE